MILGIIPARGGSKGIYKKNIKMIAGKPLLAWTIDSAKRSKLLDRYIVSTEDEEIRDISQRYGADIIIRPKELSTDDASTLSVMKHAIENIACEVIVLMQPTSPIRKITLIDECIKEFRDNDYDSLATGFICKYKEYGKSDLRRQDIQGFFYDDGNIYVIKAELIKKGDRFGRKIGRKIITRWENLDIDDEFDLWVAERILERNII